jgi:hypothetical protein
MRGRVEDLTPPAPLPCQGRGEKDWIYPGALILKSA